MSVAKKKLHPARWLRRGAVLLFCCGLLAAGVFSVWPLHVQAHFGLLGELLTERPTPEQRNEAEKSYEGGNDETPPPQTQDYFPERVFRTAIDGESFLELWRARNLRDLGEASIYARRSSPEAHSYRLTWHRSFDPEIVVRIDVEPDGSALLTAKHLARHPLKGNTPTSHTKKLTRWRGQRLVQQIDRSGFWIAPTYLEMDGLDGAMWLFEGCRDGRYHVVDRWSPKNGDPLKTLGLNMLEAAGFWRGPVY
ncbi:MAG: hypothetical protein QOE70_61 [Chthoniobacter sp.]|jgi:hypothetical protein|nr:hypothetical protein [Chthoniobacter sp.]